MSNNLLLACEGVFPIVNDSNGNTLNSIPATGLGVAGTIQGEGKLAGTPSLFIRLSGCNLRCIWQLPDGTFSRCDTHHASFSSKGAFRMKVNEVISLLRHNLGNIRHVVITGGEPLLQKLALRTLTANLKNELNLHVTLETNGTIYDSEVASHVDLFSISPKLFNSVPTKEKLQALRLMPANVYQDHNRARTNLAALQAYLNICAATIKDIQFKFVVGLPSDEDDIVNNYLNHLVGWDPSHVMVMPLGATREELAVSIPMAIEMAIRHGWRFTSRVHVDLFGSKIGV